MQIIQITFDYYFLRHRIANTAQLIAFGVSLPVQERDPLQHKPPRGLDSMGVGSPVLESVIRVLSENIESLSTRYIDQLSLFDLRKYPRLDQGTATDRDALDRTIGLLHSLVIVKR